MAKATGDKPPPLEGQLDCLFGGQIETTTWAVQHEFITNGGELTPPADFELLLDELFAVFAQRLLGPFCSTETHMTYVWGHLWSITRSRLKHRKAGEAVGDASGPVAPAQVASLITWETLERHRGGQPCSYMPGVPMQHLEDDAHFRTDVLAQLVAATNNYIADVRQVEAGSVKVLDFVDLSWIAGGAYRLAPLATTIVSGTVRQVPATQRRRIDRAAR